MTYNLARTEEELREAAKEALEGWLEAHLIDGEAPPRPKRRRATAGHWLVDVDPALSVVLQIRWARQDAGLTQAELARRVGVSQQQIGKLERHGANPSLDTLERLARALGARLEVKLLKPEPPAPEGLRMVKSREAPASRREVLDSVERIVKSSNGVSASDVARRAGMLQTRAAAALKELKLAKRIFQGGDRRFARYAGDAKTAEQASRNARKTTSGLLTAGGGGGGSQPSEKSAAPKVIRKPAARAPQPAAR